jgi:hypothetical protein
MPKSRVTDKPIVRRRNEHEAGAGVAEGYAVINSKDD